jgi:hypothetical protein
VIVAPRTIPLAGFTAVGPSVIVPPRAIRLEGWKGTGTGRGEPRQ